MKDKWHDELRLTIESALGILDGRPAVLPAEVLWKFLARDLLDRIDGTAPPRDAAHSRKPSSPKAVSERGADGRSLDWFS